MSCPVDNFYNTDVVAPGNTCGAYGETYSNCQPTGQSGSGQPSCCPEGYTYSNNRTGCGDCWYGTWGLQYKCFPNQPIMDPTAKINCCSNTNLPNAGPNGYCASGWCPSSANCVSYMTEHCIGGNLTSDACTQFCRNNPGKCDVALKSYCANPDNFKLPVCGCSLPDSQYAILKALQPNGLGVPITCDQRCGTNNNAIKLQGQQDCSIQSICVVNLDDVKIITEQKNPGITINQNCGNVPSGPPVGPTPSTSGLIDRIKNYIATTQGKIVLGVVIILIILFIVLLIFLFTRKSSSIEDVT